ncbi:hypothetical protein [Frankia sp. AgB32]|uniref:hypothetical protein n=1 Tax=Frankia sp. AgB32 TaxID=631119 RepID=UPI00200C0A48|nr:hypothetical protein [Frankia sp. AgB32]MCK9895579.1 hypothetical protein [Frankia sp. AgB32]
MFVDALPKVDLHSRLIFPEPQRTGNDRGGGSPQSADERRFATAALLTARRLAAQRVRYAEITISPWEHESRGVNPVAMFVGLDRGRRAAEREAGIQVRRIAEIPAAAEPGPRAARPRLRRPCRGRAPRPPAPLPETGRAVLRDELATTVAAWDPSASPSSARRAGTRGPALARRCRHSTVITGGSGYRAPGS